MPVRTQHSLLAPPPTTQRHAFKTTTAADQLVVTVSIGTTFDITIERDVENTVSIIHFAIVRAFIAASSLGLAIQAQ